jgi:hypothetical protein
VSIGTPYLIWDVGCRICKLLVHAKNSALLYHLSHIIVFVLLFYLYLGIYHSQPPPPKLAIVQRIMGNGNGNTCRLMCKVNASEKHKDIQRPYCVPVLYNLNSQGKIHENNIVITSSYPYDNKVFPSLTLTLFSTFLFILLLTMYIVSNPNPSVSVFYSCLCQ